ncbi:unnamed protein product [marine sediment metagenome]|uniref:Uncharacterized protein n=2 Tax=marine sediment metagenome TaxID=412755 RepID=X1T283_9ZZZZ
MQRRFIKWLQSDYLSTYDLEFIDEFPIPEVKRIADFIVWKPINGLINIEAKGNVNGILCEQLKDHARYCDYSFAFIPDYAWTPSWFKQKLTEYGWGLIVFNFATKGITEVLEAHKNKDIDMFINKSVRQRMKIEIIKRRAINDTQQILDL